MYLNEHLKKKAEIEDKKEKLEVTTQIITDQETVVVTTTPTAMPHYVNVDGSMSVGSGDNNNNNDKYLLIIHIFLHELNGHSQCMSFVITCCNNVLHRIDLLLLLLSLLLFAKC